MSRKSFDPDEDQPPLPPHGVPPSAADRLPCMRCGVATDKKTLSRYGARCYGCFEAYCRDPQPPQKQWTGRRPGTQSLFDRTEGEPS